MHGTSAGNAVTSSIDDGKAASSCDVSVPKKAAVYLDAAGLEAESDGAFRSGDGPLKREGEIEAVTVTRLRSSVTTAVLSSSLSPLLAALSGPGAVTPRAMVPRPLSA